MLLENNKSVYFADLFCGLGAFNLAFRKINKLNKTNFQCSFACDIDPKVAKIYEDNFNIKPHGDINKINIMDIPNFDILCAGFPCQPFSIAGKKKGLRDINKGHLFFKILEIIKSKNPKILIFENVKNLLFLSEGQDFKTIKDELLKLNYNISYKIINSKYYGVPQSRQRLFIIGHKSKNYIFRNISLNTIPVSNIINFKINKKIHFEDKYILEECKKKNGMMKYILINKNSGKGGRQGERVYDINKCGPTICSSSGGLGAKTGLYDVNGIIRTLSVEETLLMFGFNKDYNYNSLKKDKDMIKYLGNSIVVNVLEEIIKDI